MTWENPFVPGLLSTMSGAPSNEFNQFILKGGYNFAPTTKLVMGYSYARNTQNDSFLSTRQSPLVPASSLNGLVVTTVQHQVHRQAGEGYVCRRRLPLLDRDNRTPVHTYEFYDAGSQPSGASPFNAASFPGLGNNINIYANRPYSKRPTCSTPTLTTR